MFGQINTTVTTADAVLTNENFSEHTIQNTAVLIPAYNPDDKLPPFVRDLLSRGIGAVIIVNDGSHARCQCIFEELAETPGCTVIAHAVNLGKGRALKTGINHFLLSYPDFTGLVTADADGQHKAADTIAVALTLAKHPKHLVLGARRFHAGIPLRSLLGNVATRWLFALLIGKSVSDTQSGLRGISRAVGKRLMTVSGERYEYEMNVLVSARTHTRGIVEEPIDTVYIDNNESSHFNPLFDSLKIYFVLFRFALSSILASGIDLIVFTATYSLTSNLVLSLLVGRVVIGSLVNFGLNRKFVFHSQGSALWPLFKYYLLFTFNAFLSYVLIDYFTTQHQANIVWAKVGVESLLFIASFAIQRALIFSSDPEVD